MVWYIKCFSLPDVYIQNISALFHLFITVQYLLSYVCSLSGILTAVLAALTKKSLRHLRIAIKIQVRKPRHHGICAMNAIPFPVARRFFRIKIVPAVFRIEIMKFMCRYSTHVIHSQNFFLLCQSHVTKTIQSLRCLLYTSFPLLT